jgi:hypothetical protein
MLFILEPWTGPSVRSNALPESWTGLRSGSERFAFELWFGTGPGHPYLRQAAQPLSLLLLHMLFNMVDQRKKAKKPKKNSKVAPKGPTITIPKASKPPKLRPKPKPAYRGASSALSNSEPELIGAQQDGGAVDNAIQGLLGLGAMLGGGTTESEGDEMEIVENGKWKRPISEDEGEGEGPDEGSLCGREDEDDDSSSEEEPEDEGKYQHFCIFAWDLIMKHRRLSSCYSRSGPLWRCYGLHDCHVRCQLDRLPVPTV